MLDLPMPFIVDLQVQGGQCDDIDSDDQDSESEPLICPAGPGKTRCNEDKYGDRKAINGHPLIQDQSHNLESIDGGQPGNAERDRDSAKIAEVIGPRPVTNPE